MLKPLTTTFKGREITLECTHRRQFPPPQMYGSTPEDIDTLWKQGTIDQNQYQHLKVWHEKCGLMVMGPRCLDCPLALKQNPRPGRPNVIETEEWLAAKEKFHWEDMKAGKLDVSDSDEEQMQLAGDNGEPVHAGSHDEEFPVEPTPEVLPSANPPTQEEAEEAVAAEQPSPEPDPEPSIADMLGEGSGDAEEKEGSDLDEDIISALADD